MSRTCEICGKGTKTGFKVSHSNIKTKRKWKANIQKARILIKGIRRQVNICSRCLKSGKFQHTP